MIYEYDKKHLRECYHGNKDAMRKVGDCVIWTQEHIQKCFAFGEGTEKDLREYMRNNTRYCIFEDIIDNNKNKSNIKVVI